MHQAELDDFFADIIVELEEREYKEHPSERVIEDYLARRIKDGSELPGRDWDLSTVSLHIATCPECSAKIAKLREEELSRARAREAQTQQAKISERLKRFFGSLSDRTQERIIAWDLDRKSTVYIPLAYAAACLLLFLISLLPGPTPPVGGGGSAFPKRMM